MFENSKPENSIALDFDKQTDKDDVPLLDKEPTHEDSITTKQSLSVGQIVWKVVRNGIPTAIAMSDYYIILIICFMLSKDALTPEATQAIKYHMTITDIFIITANIGMIESVGIYGSQAYGRDDKKRIYQLMCQGIFVSCIYFFIAIFPITAYSDDLLEFMGYDFAITDILTGLQMWLAPGLLLKMVTDCMKTFLFCHKRYVLIGLLSSLNIAITFPLAYFKCSKDVISSADIGWVILFYEIVNLVLCFLAIRLSFTKEEREDHCQLLYCVRLELDWFTWEWMKNCFTEYYFAILRQVVVFIVSLTGSHGQIAAFADLQLAMKIMISISYGFYVYPRTKINIINGMYLTHDTDPNPKVNNGLDFFKQLFKALSIIAGVLSIIMCGVCYLISNTLGSEVEAGWIISVIFLFGLCSFLFMFVPFMHGTLRSLDHKYMLIIYNTIVPLILLPYICYVLTIKNDFALFGVFCCLGGELVLRITVYYFVILNSDWKEKYNYLKEIVPNDGSKE